MLRLHRGELLGALLGVVGGQLVEAVEQRLGLRDALLHVAEHVLGLVQVGLLLEHPHRGPGRERGLPAVLLVEPRHDPQQRRLAGAVVAEHPDLRAGVERERELGEHRLVRRVHLGEAVHREDVLGGHARAGYEPSRGATVCGSMPTVLDIEQQMLLLELEPPLSGGRARPSPEPPPI